MDRRKQMIRTSKHNVTNISNPGKLKQLDDMFINYKYDLGIYINYIIDGILPLKLNLSSKLLPNELINHSRYKQLIYKHASEIIRSQTKKALQKRYVRYKKIYKYFVKNRPNNSFVKTKFSKLQLKEIYQTKYFVIPNLQNLSINLDERFFDLQSGVSFDKFIKIILPFFNQNGTRALKINIPLKEHKHSNELRDNGFTLKNNIQIKQVNGNYYINLIWFKEEIIKREVGKSIGIDLGVNKLIVSSDGQFIGLGMKRIYEKIRNKTRKSKSFYRSLEERTNLTNYYINQLDLINIKTLFVENLINVKKNTSFKKQNKKKFKRKQYEKINDINSRWIYPLAINKLERICEEKGILLVKVSPAYTSQTCSNCDNVNEKSRNGKIFLCISCGFKIDADLNAAINIRNRGIYSLSDKKAA